LAHENQHRLDIAEDGTTNEAYATFSAKMHYMVLLKALGLEGNDEMKKEMDNVLENPLSYIDNQGSVHYWTLAENGSLLFDGDGWLKDTNGNYILDDNGDKIGAESIQGGLQNILGIDVKEATAMLYDQGFVFVGEEGLYWKNDANSGAAITLNNELYAELYGELLYDHNTLNIYNSLVESGQMDRNYDISMLGQGIGVFASGGYISYEDFKANNFIQGRPDIQTNDYLKDYVISTLFGARGNLSPNAHRGVDSATLSGTTLNPVLWNEETSVLRAILGLTTAQGNNITTKTPISYIFKGNLVEENIFTRYLHLNSIAVRDNQGINGASLLGQSGSSGQWIFYNDDGTSETMTYNPHLHLDMYTNNHSPYINFLNMQNNSDSIFYSNSFYFDPFLFLDLNLYDINDNAHLYNR